MYQNHHRVIEELFTWLNTTCYGLDFQRLPSKQKANTDMGWGGVDKKLYFDDSSF